MHMFNTSNEFIINKDAEIESYKYRFLSIIFNSKCTALVYCALKKEENKALLDTRRYPSVLEVMAGGEKITFKDTVGYDNNSCFYKKIEEHYREINLIENKDSLCFYVGYGEKTHCNKFEKCKNDEIEITLMKNENEIYIGKEFSLKGGERYYYNLQGEQKSFFIDKIIKTDNSKTIVYIAEGGYRLNFFLKDYLKECSRMTNKMMCDIMRDKDIKDKKICSCELPQKICDDNLYELFSVVTVNERIIKVRI